MYYQIYHYTIVVFVLLFSFRDLKFNIYFDQNKLFILSLLSIFVLYQL